MKRLLPLLCLAVATAGWTDDLEPGVQTSSAAIPAPVSAATAPAAAPAPAPAPAPARTAPQKAAAGPAMAPGASAAGKRAAPAGSGHAHDQIELDATQITGNRELPNVMYVVPWKKPDLGDFAGRPPKSLLDELLAPVDREVFRRQNRYFAALHPDAAPAAAPAPAPAIVPEAGTVPAPPAGDEK